MTQYNIEYNEEQDQYLLFQSGLTAPIRSSNSADALREYVEDELHGQVAPVSHKYVMPELKNIKQLAEELDLSIR